MLQCESWSDFDCRVYLYWVWNDLTIKDDSHCDCCRLRELAWAAVTPRFSVARYWAWLGSHLSSSWMCQSWIGRPWRCCRPCAAACKWQPLSSCFAVVEGVISCLQLDCLSCWCTSALRRDCLSSCCLWSSWACCTAELLGTMAVWPSLWGRDVL